MVAYLDNSEISSPPSTSQERELVQTLSTTHTSNNETTSVATTGVSPIAVKKKSTKDSSLLTSHAEGGGICTDQTQPSTEKNSNAKSDETHHTLRTSTLHSRETKAIAGTNVDHYRGLTFQEFQNKCVTIGNFYIYLQGSIIQNPCNDHISGS